MRLGSLFVFIGVLTESGQAGRYFTRSSARASPGVHRPGRLQSRTELETQAAFADHDLWFSSRQTVTNSRSCGINHVWGVWSWFDRLLFTPWIDPACDHTLDLRFSRLGPSAAAALAQALAQDSVRVTAVDLDGNPLGGRGASAIVAASVRPGSTVYRLSFTATGLDDEAAKRIATAISDPNCMLTHLLLSKNRIGDTGTAALAAALERPGNRIAQLYLYKNIIGDLGAEAIAGALRSPHTHLIGLDLGHNNIGNSGARLLADTLRQPSLSLSWLHLYSNQFDRESADALYSAAWSSNALTFIGLDHSPTAVDERAKEIDLDAVFQDLKRALEHEIGIGLRDLNDLLILHTQGLLTVLEPMVSAVIWRRVTNRYTSKALDYGAMELLSSLAWPSDSKSTTLEAWAEAMPLTDETIRALRELGVKSPASLGDLGEATLSTLTPAVQQAWVRVGVNEIQKRRRQQQLLVRQQGGKETGQEEYVVGNDEL